jgi:uncharacterized protein (DUF1015 family)
MASELLRAEKSMVDIRPFRAIRYTEKAGNIKNLITQPYDKIDQDMQREYYEKSPYNYCRLILPIEENRYETVHQRIYEWLNEHILAKDDQPGLFIFRQEFLLDGKQYARTGMLAALRLYPYSENMVFPHEVTFSAPKADRLNMLRTIQKDLEPVFLIYSDPENVTVNFFAEVAKTKPLVEVEDQFFVRHKLWQVTDPQKIALVQEALKDKILVISDGHHRYESALAYRDEKRKQVSWTDESAFNFHMSYIVPVQDEGLVILPTHRLLRKATLTSQIIERIKKYFEVIELSAKEDVIETFLSSRKTEHAFVIYNGSIAYGLILKDEKAVIATPNGVNSNEVRMLDVVILRDFIFKTLMNTGELKMDDVLYERSLRVAMDKIDNGQAKLAFLVNPIDPAMVWQIAQKRERLPEKSTDFYPKPVSGLAMMDIATEEKL